MIDSVKLRALVKERGLKYHYIANYMGISRYALQQKIDNRTEFKTSEITAFCEAVGGIGLEEKEQLFFLQSA